MKAAVGTALSLTGVLVAGSAAALVNAQVLQGSDGSSATVLEPAPTSTAATATPLTSVPGQVVLRVGDAGVVTLERSGTGLSIVAVVPSPGWQAGASGVGAFGEAEVHLVGATVEVTVRAWIADGEVETEVSARGIAPADNPAGAGPDSTPPTTPAISKPPPGPRPVPASPAVPAQPGDGAAGQGPGVEHVTDEGAPASTEHVEDDEDDHRGEHEDDDDVEHDD